MIDHAKTLDQVVKAAKAMLPEKSKADKILREIQRQEKKDMVQPASNTSGDTEPEE
ncbi:unnamed protein product [marine sediment metagenome]|uniref:Uncharacterized protein n=1 Tax=marine sediment metagenome TaxID=412755 RepID=X1BZG7_9ZZZZ